MTRQEARAAINARLPYELEKAQVSGYICPLCGSGSGKNGTGIDTPDGKHYKCFACEFYGDYLDLLKAQHKTTKEWDVFMMYDLRIDDNPPFPVPALGADGSNRRQKRNDLSADYSQYYTECHARAEQTDYFTRRGISKETVDCFGLGYDPNWKPPTAPQAPATARIIIPTGKDSYTARAISPDASIQKQKVGASCLFNAIALQRAECSHVFIVEGEFDALSIIEVGRQAIALCSTSNTNKLIKTLKDSPPAVPLVLALDNDEAGRKAQAVLKERLDAMKISCFEAYAAVDG